MSTSFDLSQLEPSLAEIATLVEQMEQGTLTLEQALACFERGISLVKQCQGLLTEAEQKVQILLDQHEQAELVPYQIAEHPDQLLAGQVDGGTIT